MIAFIIKRILLAAFTLLVISYISFVMVQLPPGDLVDQYMNTVFDVETAMQAPRMQVDVQALRALWRLDRPLFVQWADWMWDIISRGDFGTTLIEYSNSGGVGTGDIRTLIGERLPFTIYLSVVTIIITWTFAIPVGIYSAVRKNSIGDYLFTFVGFVGLAIPDFLLGLVLMYVFFAYFGHSVGGLFSGDYIIAPWSLGRVIDMLQHMIIPALVIGTAGTAGLIRVMRNNLLDELQKPYVVTARAKGLPYWKVVARYPVRVALNPFISGIGGLLPGLIGADAIVSIVLSLPTLGPLLLTSVLQQDGPLAGAFILMYSSLSVIGVLISDLMLVVVDPRIKLTGSARGSSETV